MVLLNVLQVPTMKLEPSPSKSFQPELLGCTSVFPLVHEVNIDWPGPIPQQVLGPGQMALLIQSQIRISLLTGVGIHNSQLRLLFRTQTQAQIWLVQKLGMVKL
jgi:hypothetical protein